MMHAVAGGQTRTTLSTPLIVLLEVTVADVLMPMIETVAVLKDEWGFMLEKVLGHVEQIAALSAQYGLIADELEAMLCVLLELYETMRQCETEMCISLHLTDKEYKKDLRNELKAEVLNRMVDILWRLSTHLLKMQLAIVSGKSRASNQLKSQQMQLLTEAMVGVQMKRGRSWFGRAKK